MNYDHSHTSMALVNEDIKDAAQPLGTSHCVYSLSLIHRYVADDGYRLMGFTGSWKSNVQAILCYTFAFLHASKDHRHPCLSTWQTFRPLVCGHARLRLALSDCTNIRSTATVWFFWILLGSMVTTHPNWRYFKSLETGSRKCKSCIYFCV